MVCLLEHAELTPRVVLAIVRPLWKDKTDAEVVRRWPEQLLAQHRDKLDAPEELILQVDKTARPTQRSSTADLPDRYSRLSVIQRSLLTSAARSGLPGRRFRFRERTADTPLAQCWAMTLELARPAMGADGAGGNSPDLLSETDLWPLAARHLRSRRCQLHGGERRHRCMNPGRSVVALGPP
jgi:hypothetical protein